MCLIQWTMLHESVPQRALRKSRMLRPTLSIILRPLWRQQPTSPPQRASTLAQRLLRHPTHWFHGRCRHHFIQNRRPTQRPFLCQEPHRLLPTTARQPNEQSHRLPTRLPRHMPILLHTRSFSNLQSWVHRLFSSSAPSHGIHLNAKIDGKTPRTPHTQRQE